MRGRLSACGGVTATVLAVAGSAAFAVVAPAAQAHPVRVSRTRAAVLFRAAARTRRAEHAAGARAHAAIVGGSATAIEQVPWQVLVLARVEGGALLCGGSIVGDSKIVTAGHCVINPESEVPIPAKSVLVVAGTSSFAPGAIETGASVQIGTVTAVRVHPYFDYGDGPGTADDVATLTLAEPLERTAAVEPIALVPAGPGVAESTSVKLSGFGFENPEADEPDGSLNSLSLTVGYSRECGGEGDALFVCASSQSGSACFGDSGSGLTRSGGPPTLLAVMDTVGDVEGEPCRSGSLNGFVNLAAPEIRDFVEGEASPPRAPRGGHAAIRGVPLVGRLLTCEPGSWSDATSFTYVFQDAASGATLAAGASSTYPLAPTDAGRMIRCEVQAQSAGGTGIGRTPGLGPIEPGATSQGPGQGGGGALPTGPPTVAGTGPSTGSTGVAGFAAEISSVSLLGSTLSVRSGHAAARLVCRGTRSCQGTLTLSVRRTVHVGGKRELRSVTVGQAGFELAGGARRTVEIPLAREVRASVATAGSRLSAHLTIVGLETAPASGRREAVTLEAPQAKSRRSS